MSIRFRSVVFAPRALFDALFASKIAYVSDSSLPFFPHPGNSRFGHLRCWSDVYCSASSVTSFSFSNKTHAPRLAIGVERVNTASA
jgi:hypothetical protein